MNHLSTIESFPTELWCGIFKYFNAIELYRTFSNLNSQITSILSESTLLYFEIATIRDYNFSSCVILPVVNNCTNVRSFKFYHEFQFEEYFTLWPINKFNQLRYFSLVYLDALMNDCSIVLIEHLSALTNFKYLYIKVGRLAYRDQCLERFLQLIFAENDAFYSLKHFVFQCNTPSDLVVLPVTTKQTKLEILTLPSLYRNDFVQLLPCIPNIKLLKIHRLCTDFDSPVLLKISSIKSALQDCLDVNLQLDNKWAFDDVEFLLQQIPNVKQLKLTCRFEFMNGNKWALLLAKLCPKLQIFDLTFYDYYGDTLQLQNNFSTSFWLQKNVQFNRDNRVSSRRTVRFEI